MKLRAIMGALLLGGAIHSQAATSPYSFQLLRGFESSTAHSEAVDVNNAGMVIGTAYMEFAQSPRAALWFNGQFTDLGTLGGDRSHAYAINASGVIVGAAGLADGSLHATQWSSGQIKDLGTLSGNYSEAHGINDLGVVVGRSDTQPYGGGTHAVVWTDGGVRDLTPSGGTSTAYGINNAGTIVGESEVFMSGHHATRWQDGVATVLDYPVGEYDSKATAINGRGVAVGTDLSELGYGAFLVGQDARMTTLPGLGFNSMANDINLQGLAVGWSYSPTEGRSSAVAWIDGVAIDLNSWLDPSVKQAGWALRGAWGVNDNNWIVGRAENKFTGEMTGFLITPVPEPTTCALMLAGLGLIGAISRKRAGKREDSR